MFILPQQLPVPAVGGGAIETLITNLLDENEKRKKFRFIVISVADKRAEAFHYNCSRVYYCENEVIHYGWLPLHKAELSLMTLRHRIKSFVKRKLLGQSQNSPDYIPFKLFYIQCCKIARREKVDYIINEEDWNSRQYKRFYQIVGKEHIYYHLHGHRKEDLTFRNHISNTIAVSNFVRKEWAVDQSVEGRNIVIYNGIDIGMYSQSISQEQRKQLRNELGVADEEFLAIFCGRLIPEKGVEQLLKAFELLNESPVRLLLIGSVGFSKNVSTDFSEKMISIAKKMKSVIYLGYIPNKKMPLYYQMADFQIVPSIWQDAAPLAVMEGMASGLPLIITQSGGMVEYATDECAVKVPIDDRLPESIAESVIKLIHDPDLLQKMGEKGRERAMRYTVSHFYDGFVAEFCGEEGAGQ